MLQSDIKRALAGLGDGGVKRINRFLDAFVAMFGRDSHTAQEIYEHIRPPRAHVELYGVPHTIQQTELRDSIRQLTELDFCPDNYRQLGKLLKQFVGRYDTGRVLLFTRIDGHVRYYVREVDER